MHRSTGQGSAGAGQGLAGKVLCSGTEGRWAGAVKHQWAVMWSGSNDAPNIVREGHVRTSPVGPTGVVRLNLLDVQLRVCLCAVWLSDSA